MIIGLTGRKRVGKDTTADYLVKNNNFFKTSFALPLKKACQIIFDFSEEQLETDEKENIDDRWNITPRKIFQIVGTELMRNYFPKLLPECKIEGGFWVHRFNIWYRKWKNNNDGKNLVIADVRFQDEIDIVKKYGGIIIKINRDTKYNDTHISEKIDNLESIDYNLDNNGSFGSLYNNIDNLYNKLNKN